VTAPAPNAPRVEPVSDLLILSAIHRAERHGRAEGVLWRRIREHMGVVGGASTTRALRVQVEALAAVGQVGVSQRYGSKVWGLTGKGRRRLARARRAGRVPALPEAPQHQAWRHEHKQASERIDALRGELCDALAQAKVILECDESAAAWFAFSRSLRARCVELGWAIHCLYEWAEPDDASADVDRGERRRRLDLASVSNSGQFWAP
jgi:hypothetical protein